MRIILLSLLLLLATPAWCAPENTEPVPDAAPGLDEEGLEPEVTIIQRGGETVEEYRVNGQLYLVKVEPAKGQPYYLLDTDGDGSLDSRRNELDPRILIPHWIILRW